MNSSLVNDSYYHVFNRGVEKRTIFQSSQDYYRFMMTIDYYRFHPTPRKLSTHLRFNEELPRPTAAQKKLVEVLSFCLMPNHFHFLLKQLEDKGISEFLRRISDSYTRFFNTKYDRVGPLFQGKFKAKLIDRDQYLVYLSKYIHRNPVTLPKWNTKLDDYTFSSYSGYLNPKRKFPFCETETISSYFNSQNPNLSYQSFVEESPELVLPEELLLDDR